MQALVKSKGEKGIWLTDVSVPEYGHNDVLIKIKKTAICGTDLHIYNWDEWAQVRIPVGLTIGHEFVGEIVEVGQDVQGLKPGMRVSGEGHIACGFCRRCRGGLRHICRQNVSVGVTRNGCFAEYLAIPAVNAYPLPDSIPDNIAAILDPLGNAVHTTLAFSVIGEDVLITGAGPVGLMAAAIARHVGARFVIISDVNDYRLDIAKKMGVTFPINSMHTTLKEAMNTLEMKEGYDVGLEMSGNSSAFRNMLEFMTHGGKVALLGFLPQDTQIDWNNIIMKGLQVKGIYGREMFETWYTMVSMLQSGLDVSDVITHEFSYQDFDKAFEIMSFGQCGKIILNWM
jgi:threonine 3-dehydrogenase